MSSTKSQPTLVVINEDGEPRASSRVIAKGMRQQHASVIKLIRAYSGSLSEFGLLDLKSESTRGRPTEHALLNEQQAAFLITLMRNNDKVVAFKVSLIKEFFRMREALTRRDQGTWQRYFEKKAALKNEQDHIGFCASEMRKWQDEGPPKKAEVDRLLSDMQPGLFVN